MALLVMAAWFALAFWVATHAEKRGRSAGGWFTLSAIFSPLVGVALLMALPEIERASPLLVRCPACRELIRRDAVKCKHCGTEINSD